MIERAETTEDEVKSLRAVVKDLENQTGLLEERIENTKKESASLEKLLENSNNELTLEKSLTESARIEALEKAKVIEVIMESKSWRLTAPLRAIMGLLRIAFGQIISRVIGTNSNSK